MDIKIFIGSSTENLQVAKWAKKLIGDLQSEFKDAHLSPFGWWDDGEFPIGKSFYESLFNILDRTEAGIFIAGEEDIIIKRTKESPGPRDNIILEFGLVEGKKGRGRALLGIVGMPDLPSDLEGINHLQLSDVSNEELFLKNNRDRLRSWICQIQKDMNDSIPLSIYFPKLYSSLLKTIQEFKSGKTSFSRDDIDILISDVLDQVTSAFDEDSYITSLLINSIKDELPQCRSILAVDVMGPRAWITPNAYRYLATQITYYLRKNLQDDQWKPVLSDELFERIMDACTLLKTQYKMQQSLSGFNSEPDFTFTKGQPRLEFARVLLWSREELMCSLGDSVIAIHQAFNIPLFFKAVEPENELRNLDYVLFEQNNGTVSGFYSSKSTERKPMQFNNDIIPGIGNAKEQFYSLFKNSKLMLAIDARALLRENPKVDFE